MLSDWYKPRLKRTAEEKKRKKRKEKKEEEEEKKERIPGLRMYVHMTKDMLRKQISLP